MRRPTALLLALAAATVAAAAAPPPKVCRVSEHVADPSAATAGIQATFDACAVGGTILFDIPGVAYTSGAVVLTGRDLHVVIPPGVALQASTRREDYPGPQSEWYLLHFRNCTGCSLSGGGAVDGRARAWIVGRRPAARDEDSVKVFRQFDFADPTARCYKPTECRPRLVGVRHSDGVTISGVSLLDPVYWCLHIQGSRHVTVQDVYIKGDWEVFNNDGVDIDSSSDVEVLHSTIDTADDALCVKSMLPGVPVKRVLARNVTLRSRAAAIKLGSESSADMRDMLFEDVRVLDSHRGLAIQLRDGGSVRNVTFRRARLGPLRHNLEEWWGAAEVIYVTATPRVPGAACGTIYGVEFADIEAVAENGVVIAGYGECTVSDVAVRRLRLELRNASAYAGAFVDYRPSMRGVDHRGRAGVAALWVEGASGVLFEDVAVTYGAPRRADWAADAHVDAATTARVRMRNVTFANAAAGGDALGGAFADTARSAAAALAQS